MQKRLLVFYYFSSFQKCSLETVITFSPKFHQACQKEACMQSHAHALVEAN